jgi:hypothetical protein
MEAFVKRCKQCKHAPKENGLRCRFMPFAKNTKIYLIAQKKWAMALGDD